MRTQKTVEKLVPRLVIEYGPVSCDLCGYDEDESYIFEIKIEIAADSCAGTRITRDVCQDCYDDKLANAFTIMFNDLEAGQEKHQWRIEDEGDRWYG